MALINWNLGFNNRDSRTIRVMLLGQSGVGKTAMATRFVTRRFIGDYDSSAEKIYKIQTNLACWEIMDLPSNLADSADRKLRCAEAIILLYSVTDRVSFDETSRLRFWVTHAKKGKKIQPVILLVGNKTDLANSPEERMVSSAEGRKMADNIEAHGFHEISVRESVDQVMAVFTNIARLLANLPANSSNQLTFRLRASTDGSINSLRRPSPTTSKRRFSTSARGAPL